jgi:hypothetical protein
MRPHPPTPGRLLLVLLAALPSFADAGPAPRSPALRFPARVSDAVVRDLIAAGRVGAKDELRAPETSQRWGGADVVRQEVALRAVLAALARARPSLDVSAAILAIARVESGFNPDSKNPSSTACGIFQFVAGTWERYNDAREACVEPGPNAIAGVKHLTTLHTEFVRDAVPPRNELPDEEQRLEHTYRLLYAYHYHGSGSAFAPQGGSVEAQLVAEAGVPHLRQFFSILKRAVYVPPRPARKRPVVRAAARRRGSRTVRSTQSRGVQSTQRGKGRSASAT